MEDGPKSNPILDYDPDETTLLCPTVKVLPAAPRAYWEVTPRRDDVDQQPPFGQHILAQPPGQPLRAQPGQCVVPGQPAFLYSEQPVATVPGQLGYTQPSQSVVLDQPAYAQPGQTNLVQPVMYMFQDVQPFSIYSRPSSPSPHSHLQFAIITTLFCFILNITSLSLRIPALILAIIANIHIKNGHWRGARAMVHAALYLSIINWIYTLGTALMNLGCLLQFGTYYDDNDYYYNDY